jgi:ribosomal silencing factor RsfS
LSGDKGRSHLFTKPPKEGLPRVIREEDLDEEIEKFMAQDSADDENSSYTIIDLDDVEAPDGDFTAKDYMIDGQNFNIEKLMDDVESMDVENKYQSLHDDKFQKHFEVKDFNDAPSTSQEKNGVPDWLSTRRARLSRTSAISMMTPDDLRKKQRETDDIPVIKHTLLSSEEIITCLVKGGAQDVKLVTPEKDFQSYLGWEGLIIATASSYSHIRILTDSLVYNLRKRGLAECGVVGAKYGSEGGEDLTMSNRARRKRNIGRGKKTDDGWISVDCRNYIVHVQDELTRKSVDLEGLWKPGSEQAKLLRKIDSRDEDALDDFVASNPVPEEYIESMKMQSDVWGQDGRGGYAVTRSTIKKSGRFTPNSNQQRKAKNRGRYSL